MRHFGVVYDVGLHFSGTERSSVDPFDPDLVRHDMQAISELGANAVRIEGQEIDRLIVATRAAHDAGLSVFLSPWKMDAGFRETLEYVSTCAAAAEQLRSEGAEIVFIVGCEYTIFSDGIYPGSGVYERGAWAYRKLRDGGGEREGGGWPDSPEGLPDPFPEKATQLNGVLAALAEASRQSFDGPITYSAAIFEDVDWSIFDMVGVNYYRETQTDEEYVAGLDYFRQWGKPIAIPEFGCCTYKGAAARGGRGFLVLQGTTEDGVGLFEGGVVPTRDETEQADYIERQFRLFAKADVSAAFVFVFAYSPYPTGEGAKDLDLASYSMVKHFRAEDPRSKAFPPWEAKESYYRAGGVFQELSRWTVEPRR